MKRILVVFVSHHSVFLNVIYTTRRAKISVMRYNLTMLNEIDYKTAHKPCWSHWDSDARYHGDNKQIFTLYFLNAEDVITADMYPCHWILKTPFWGGFHGHLHLMRKLTLGELQSIALGFPATALGLKPRSVNFSIQAYDQLDYTDRCCILRKVHLIILAEG